MCCPLFLCGKHILSVVLCTYNYILGGHIDERKRK